MEKSSQRRDRKMKNMSPGHNLFTETLFSRNANFIRFKLGFTGLGVADVSLKLKLSTFCYFLLLTGGLLAIALNNKAIRSG